MGSPPKNVETGSLHLDGYVIWVMEESLADPWQPGPEKGFAVVLVLRRRRTAWKFEGTTLRVLAP